MAKGNMLLGQASRKLGSLVFYVRNGRQVSRVWTESGARRGKDASFPARSQRVQFGAASNIWKAYRYISTRMFNIGKKPTESDYNFFTKLNWRYFPYLTKELNAAQFYCPVPGEYSRGNLGDNALALVITDNSDAKSLSYQLKTSLYAGDEEITFADKMSQLISFLRGVYPNADKVTYMLIVQWPSAIEIDGNDYGAERWDYNTIVIDLNETDTAILNTAVGKYFMDRFVTGAQFLDQWKKMNDIISNGSILNLHVTYTTDNPPEYTVYPLVFATNSSANDCYSTNMMPGNFPLSDGPFVWWNFYRSEAAFQNACSSYGYTSGVMQTAINQTGIDITSSFADYVEVVRSISPETAALYDAALADSPDDAPYIPLRELTKRYGGAASKAKKIKE